MDDEKNATFATAQIIDAANLLRSAREAKGLSLKQVSATTRITAGHLEMIEAGHFADLPGRTYAVGFAKNFARAVGVDEDKVAQLVREELIGAEPRYHPHDQEDNFAPGDPGKVPPWGLVIATGGAAILLIGGLAAFYNVYFGSGAGPGEWVEEAGQTMSGLRPSAASSMEDAAAEGPIPSTGQVVFTALEEGVWVRFYDGQGTVLLEKQMARQEQWTVPPDAVEPQIRTGRPDAFAITVGGRPVSALDSEPKVVSDIGVSAQALLARDRAPAMGTPAP